MPSLRTATQAMLGRVGIPPEVLGYVNWPTDYDRRNTTAALAGSDIEVPRLETYAGRIWDHWEQQLDPGRFGNGALTARIRGRTVLVTGASDGIGREVALQAGAAGAHVLLVSRTRERLEAVQAEIVGAGGTAWVHPADLSDVEDVDRLADEVLDQHGAVDVLVNNAGRSIRRSVRLSVDRFHDYERTMQLNYFGAVQLVLKLLPAMARQPQSHIINVSSIGVQTNTPRFSAYVASKAALDAFSRCIASEVIDDGVHVTTVYMPLVRTKMIAPTRLYDYFPAITPQRAAEMVCDAMLDRPKKVATWLGNLGEVSYAVAPKVVDRVLHLGYRTFPESTAAKGGDNGEAERTSSEGLALAHLLRGVHW
jgi:short-subunit dehydrogenase